MKALVLSGGSGTRLRPLSHSLPKQLVPIAGRPILEHALDDIRRLGITDIGIVVATPGSEIEDAIGSGSRFGARISYLVQDEPAGLAHAVRIARPFLGADDFLMYLGDNVLAGGLDEIADDFARWRPAAQLAAYKVPDPRDFGVVEVGAENQVLRLCEKPAEPRSDLALIGVYFFTAAVHRAVDAIRPSARGELEITDAVQWMVDRGDPVRVREYTGFWRDAGKPEDVLACNRQLLDELPARITGTVDAASQLGARVVVEAGARVRGCVIEGPAIIGAGSLIEDSWIGPYTAIGQDCTVRGSRVADSILLDHVTVVGVLGLHGSLVGRRARVAGAARHRLLVGDDTSVELAA